MKSIFPLRYFGERKKFKLIPPGGMPEKGRNGVTAGLNIKRGNRALPSKS